MRGKFESEQPPGHCLVAQQSSLVGGDGAICCPIKISVISLSNCLTPDSFFDAVSKIQALRRMSGYSVKNGGQALGLHHAAGFYGLIDHHFLHG